MSVCVTHFSLMSALQIAPKWPLSYCLQSTRPRSEIGRRHHVNVLSCDAAKIDIHLCVEFDIIIHCDRFLGFRWCFCLGCFGDRCTLCKVFSAQQMSKHHSYTTIVKIGNEPNSHLLFISSTMCKISTYRTHAHRTLFPFRRTSRIGKGAKWKERSFARKQINSHYDLLLLVAISVCLCFSF